VQQNRLREENAPSRPTLLQKICQITAGDSLPHMEKHLPAMFSLKRLKVIKSI